MPREFTRNERLSGQILRLLNDLVQQESKDPRLTGVTFSAVDVARDLAVADVYFILLDPDASPDEAMAGLASAGGFFRTRVGGALKIRHTPQLRFRHDNSAARGAEISALIDAATRDTDDS